jgi:hypothetical protein
MKVGRVRVITTGTILKQSDFHSLPEFTTLFINMISFILSLADDCGTISWFYAVGFAKSHGILEDLLNDYHMMIGERVDAGELLVWAGY